MNELLESLFDRHVILGEEMKVQQDLAPLPHCKGILLFADGRGAPILLLSAADLKRVAINRLACADAQIASRRVRLSEITRLLYYRCCYCDFACSLEHYRIARKLLPDRYKDSISLPAVHYVRINIAAKWPAFTITENPQGFDAIDTAVLGPFPSRRLAGEFISVLEESFGLCRQQCLIDDPNKARSCPYYQMHTCKAPCLGGMPREEYAQQVRGAVEAAGGNLDKFITIFEQDMRMLAAQMKFEEAQVLKRRLERLKTLDNPEYRRIADLRELAILHIDRGPRIAVAGKKQKTQSYMAFVIGGSSISRLSDCTLDTVERLHREAEAVRHSVMPPTDDFAEELALASAAMYRSKAAGLWIDMRNLTCADALRKVMTAGLS